VSTLVLTSRAPSAARRAPSPTAPVAAAGIARWMERLADVLTGRPDLDRIAAVVGDALEALIRPRWYVVLLTDGQGGSRALVAEDGERTGRAVPLNGPLPSWLAGLRTPRPGRRGDGLASGDRPLGPDVAPELVVPLVFADTTTGALLLGPARNGRSYGAEELGLLRPLAKQCAVALEQVKARSMLAAAEVELEATRGRVALLEDVRAHLAKFVPQTVQRLIERAPDAPDLGRQEAEVSVLFVDIVGYTRLTEELDSRRASYLIERYFGAFLDEILARGGDVNETSGDGLMVIFRDPDPACHARAAVTAALAIIRRTLELNAELTELFEPVAIHVGVNSGVATLGVTRIAGEAGSRWTYTAAGSLTNVAARLAKLSPGNAVLVGPGTRERVADEFAFVEEGSVALRNVAEPVGVFRLDVPGLNPLAVSRE
jgi:class 3 adenylate cyclase